MLLPSVWFDSIAVTTTTTVTITGEPGLAPPSMVAPASEPAPPPMVAPSPPSSAPPALHPVWLTLAAGPALGIDTKDKCAELECVALAGSLGFAVNAHLGLVIAGTVMDTADRMSRATHHVETVGLRYSAARVWAEGGVGVGSKRSWIYSEPSSMDLSGVDPAASLGAGYEVLVRPDYAISVQARVATTVTDIEHTCFAQLGLGVTLF